MNIQEEIYELKDHRKITLKSAQIKDARMLCEFNYITAGETYFLSRNQEEVGIFVEEMKERIKGILEDEKDFMINVFYGNELIGNMAVLKVKNHMKYEHRAMMGISILQEYCNLGIGKILLQRAIKQTKENGFLQLELGVFEDNERARHVYETIGFWQVGIIPRAYRLKDGSFRDEIQMVYLF